MTGIGYDQAVEKLRRLLSDGEWHSRTVEIGGLLPDIPDGWFLRIKQELGIEYRFNGVNGPGSRGPGSRSEWRLPPLG
jgi:hypothetical protein